MTSATGITRMKRRDLLNPRLVCPSDLNVGERIKPSSRTASERPCSAAFNIFGGVRHRPLVRPKRSATGSPMEVRRSRPRAAPSVHPARANPAKIGRRPPMGHDPVNGRALGITENRWKLSRPLEKELRRINPIVLSGDSGIRSAIMIATKQVLAEVPVHLLCCGVCSIKHLVYLSRVPLVQISSRRE